MKTRRKNYIFFLIILISLITIVWFLQISKAKYKGQKEIELAITATPFYFDHTGKNITIAYNNNTANIDLTVHNYIKNDYTIENINYTITIQSSNYTVAVDEINLASDNSVPLVLEGGARNSQILNLKFNRRDTTNVPDTETFPITISTNYPYIYSSTFNVTITNGAIDVKGNPTNWTKDDVTLTIVPTTDGTELIEYSFDNGATWTDNASKVYTENTSNITIYAKDTNGGILGPVDIDITRIDKTKPEFNITKDIEYNKDETTKEVETLIVYLGEKTSVLKNISVTETQSGISAEGIKCYRGEQEITTTDYFTNVGRYSVKYKVSDEVGNEQIINREILVRWPLAGKYIVAATEKLRNGIMGVGKATDTNKDGLWQDNADTGLDESLPFASKYYYAGDYGSVNNYISFANKTFRILNVSVNDSIKLITGLSGGTAKWHDRKIFESEFYANWAKFAQERRIFYSDDSNAIYLTEQQFAHIAEGTFYAGRFVRDSDQSLATLIDKERNASSNLGNNARAPFNSYFALPNVSDYIKSNNIQNTVYNIRKTQTNQSSFSNNSWLCDSSTEQWTINSKNDTSTDNDFWTLHGGNEIVSRTHYYAQHYRMVFYLNNKTIISGTGTTQDPFTVRENWAWFDQYQEVQ